MNKAFCLVLALLVSACTHSPIAPSAPVPLVLGLAGQSNSILMRPFLSQVATVVGAGDQVTTIDCWNVGGECWHHLEPSLHTRLDAFVWWQGESDVAAGTTGAAYTVALGDLVRRVRVSVANPRLLVVVMQWGACCTGGPQGPMVRQWAGQQPDLQFVDTQDLEYRWWDSAHMTEVGYAAVSARIASIVRARR